MKILSLNQNLISLETPIIMGILNITEDSFFDGGRYITETTVLKRVEQMLEEGAAIVDLGAVSTQPNAINIAENREFDEIKKYLRLILSHFPEASISIDTFRASVAEMAIQDTGNRWRTRTGERPQANRVVPASRGNPTTVRCNGNGSDPQLMSFEHGLIRSGIRRLQVVNPGRCVVAARHQPTGIVADLHDMDRSFMSPEYDRLGNDAVFQQVQVPKPNDIRVLCRLRAFGTTVSVVDRYDDAGSISK